MLSRLTVAGVAVVGLAALGCSGKADSRRPRDAPRRVQVVKAEKRKIPRTVVAVGTLAAEDRAELGFKVPGRLARWDVDLGSRVAAERSSLSSTRATTSSARPRSGGARAGARPARPAGGRRRATRSTPQKVGVVRQAKAAPGPGRA